MRQQIMMYLEEYARQLESDRNNRLAEEVLDKDSGAAREARETQAKIRDIRGIIAFLSRHPEIKLQS